LIEDHSAGDLICPECGLVVEERIVDPSTEWRSFEGDSIDRSRVGGPENSLISGLSLSTGIVTNLGSSDESKRLALSQRRNLSSSAERPLMEAMNTIRDISNRINIDRETQQEAAKVFKDLRDKNINRGKGAEARIAACIYIACRIKKVPRSFKEICAASNVKKKDIAHCFKLTKDHLDIGLGQLSGMDFVPRYCANLGLSPNVQRAAATIVMKITEFDLAAGKSPISIAGAAIYLASQASSDKKSFKEVAAVTGIAEPTLRVTYKLLVPRALELFPADFKFEGSQPSKN